MDRDLESISHEICKYGIRSMPIISVTGGGKREKEG